MVFNYPIKSSCPPFRKILNRLRLFQGKSVEIDQHLLPPIVQLTSKYLIFHYYTKYLYYYAVCEVSSKQDKNPQLALDPVLDKTVHQDSAEDCETTLETSDNNGSEDNEKKGSMPSKNGNGNIFDSSFEKLCSSGEDDDDDESEEDDESDDPDDESGNESSGMSENDESETDDNESESDYDESESDNELDSEKSLVSEFYQMNNHSSDNVLVPLEFLKQFIYTLTDYLGDPLVSLKLRTNYEVVCLLLNEMIEDYYPFITDLNQLKELVHKDGAFRKLIASATSSIPNNGASTLSGRSNLNNASSMRARSLQGFQKDEVHIPWRRPNVKYSNNELFVDFMEEISLTMTPSHKRVNAAKKTIDASKKDSTIKGSAFYSTNSVSNFHRNHAKPLVAKLQGQLILTTHLSGIPDLKMVLNLGGHNLKVPSFHPCVRVDKWLNQPGVMLFIPPDGKCILANYEIDLTESIFTQHKNRDILRNIGVVHGEFRTHLGSSEDEFEIIVHINLKEGVKCIENLKVIVHSEILQDQVANIKTLRLTNGDFQYNSNGKSEWILENNLLTGTNPVFRGQIVPDGTNDILFPKYVSVSFNYKGALPSGIKVDTLKVVSARNMGESVNPFKGVKYLAKSGEYVLR